MVVSYVFTRRTVRGSGWCIFPTNVSRDKEFYPMARFLIATQPITGHILPALPIVRTLVQRGHEVRW